MNFTEEEIKAIPPVAREVFLLGRNCLERLIHLPEKNATKFQQGVQSHIALLRRFIPEIASCSRTEAASSDKVTEVYKDLYNSLKHLSTAIAKVEKRQLFSLSGNKVSRELANSHDVLYKLFDKLVSKSNEKPQKISAELLPHRNHDTPEAMEESTRNEGLSSHIEDEIITEEENKYDEEWEYEDDEISHTENTNHFDTELEPSVAEHGMAEFVQGIQHLFQQTQVGDRDAYSCFLASAKTGHPRAMVQLGLMYKQGKSCDKDLSKALEWFERAAEYGQVEALNQLALLCIEGGDRINVDTQRGIQLTVQAAQGGSVDACSRLGTWLLHGAFNDAVQQDVKEGIRFLSFAAQKGHTSSSNTLGGVYATGANNILLPNKEKAMHLFTAAANGGSTVAMNNVGYCFEVGFGTAKNLERALEYYLKAAEQGHKQAMCSFGYLAIHQLRKMTKLGSNLNSDTVCLGTKQFTLAKLSQFALDYLQRAASLGVLEAHYHLGSMFDAGIIVASCRNTTVHHYLKSMDHNVTLITRVLNVDIPNLITFATTIQCANTNAAYKLGNLFYPFETTTCLVSNESLDAVKKCIFFYALSAHHGNSAAQNAIGILFEEGKLGLSIDYNLASDWYGLAATQNNIDACLNLCNMYAQGKLPIAHAQGIGHEALLGAAETLQRASDAGNQRCGRLLNALIQGGFLAVEIEQHHCTPEERYGGISNKKRVTLQANDLEFDDSQKLLRMEKSQERRNSKSLVKTMKGWFNIPPILQKKQTSKTCTNQFASQEYESDMLGMSHHENVGIQGLPSPADAEEQVLNLQHRMVHNHNNTGNSNQKVNYTGNSNLTNTENSNLNNTENSNQNVTLESDIEYQLDLFDKQDNKPTKHGTSLSPKDSVTYVQRQVSPNRNSRKQHQHGIKGHLETKHNNGTIGSTGTNVRSPNSATRRTDGHCASVLADAMTQPSTLDEAESTAVQYRGTSHSQRILEEYNTLPKTNKEIHASEASNKRNHSPRSDGSSVGLEAESQEVRPGEVEYASEDVINENNAEDMVEESTDVGDGEVDYVDMSDSIPNDVYGAESQNTTRSDTNDSMASPNEQEEYPTLDIDPHEANPDFLNFLRHQLEECVEESNNDPNVTYRSLRKIIASRTRYSYKGKAWRKWFRNEVDLIVNRK